MPQPWSIVFLALAMGPGAPVRGQGPGASFFNRSGRALRLVPQGGTCAQVRITRYHLPSMGVREGLLGSGAFPPGALELKPESLMVLAWARPEGAEPGSRLTFQVFAEAPGPPTPLGTLTLGGEAGPRGRASLEVALAPSFQVQGPGPHVVVRDADPEHDALAEAMGEAGPGTTWQGVCTIL